MKHEYRLLSHTIAVPAPSHIPPAYALLQCHDGVWRYNGPHRVAAILIVCAELAAPAQLLAATRQTPYGAEYIHNRYVAFADEFHERHFMGDKLNHVPVAFLLLPADCSEWEDIIFPSSNIVFSEQAAKSVVEKRNDLNAQGEKKHE